MLEQIVGTLGNVGAGFLSFLVALVPLIIVHEFGHLIIAKLSGVWVREFGVGFPPRIVKLFRWQETDFTLNWIPLGGFAMMEGEDVIQDAENKEEEDLTPEERAEKEAAKEHSLYAAAPWKRILIYFGGPLFNILLAWALCVLLFATGVPATRIIIDGIAPNSPAEEVGLQSGDIILAVNETQIDAVTDVGAVIQPYLGQEIAMTLERDGETVVLNVVPRANPPEGEGAIGISIYADFIPGQQDRYTFSKAFRLGSQYMAGATGMTLMMPIDIIRGLIPLKEARPVGVVGISQIAQQSVTESVNVGSAYPFLNILILLSISLGIFNLLPIPALDGGRIIITLFELVRGSPLKPATQERIHQFAFLLLMALFFVITAMDILYPVEIPPMP
ncbi:MAG: site-2 protease family protein [Anaerolineae bacterium]|nr:site-2 protease family protein [Anaerolineae bacterium]